VDKPSGATRVLIRDTYRRAQCRGGVGWYTLWLAQALSRLDSVEVHTQEPGAYPGCRVTHAGERYAGSAARRGAALFLESVFPRRVQGSYDCIILPHPFEPTVRRGDGVQVLVVHDVIPLVLPPRSLRGLVNHVYYRLIVRAAMGRADRVVVPSEATRRDLLSFFDLATEKVRVIPNGFNTRLATLWAQAPQAAPTSLPPRYLAYVGNGSPHKNLNRLVQALGRLHRRLDLGLAVVGAGQPDWFPELGRRLGIEGHVVFLDEVREADVAGVLGHAQALVHPSLYEGFGMPPLEAMSLGVPVAVSGTSSLPEVCGKAALYFDPLDVDDMAATIERLVTDAEVRRRCIDEGFRQAGRFSWELTAQRFLDLTSEG